MVPKIVYTNERENITNFTITRDNSFLEAVNINMSLANASETISFPYFTENISRERVVVPTELLLNNSNSSQIYSLVSYIRDFLYKMYLMCLYTFRSQLQSLRVSITQTIVSYLFPLHRDLRIIHMS